MSDALREIIESLSALTEKERIQLAQALWGKPDTSASRIYIPASKAEQWAQFLADPVKHWRQGYSARTLAYSWQEAAGFPAEVAEVLSHQFPSLELLLAFPEHKVSLRGGSRASQNDIWVLARSEGQLVSIAVEGKVSESFDKTVGEWKADSSPGKVERLEYLRGLLGLPSVPDSVRYQLLHRAASAIIEAKRFNATHAVMLVHSFSKTGEWFDDYARFVELMGEAATKNGLVAVGTCSGIPLYLAWVSGKPAYLDK